MNGYVNGNNAYKYEGNVIVLDRNERWQAHCRAQRELQIAAARARMEVQRQKEAVHTHRMHMVVLVLQFAAAVLMLAPVCATALEALLVLWHEGIADNLTELFLVLSGVALTSVISGAVCRRAEQVLHDTVPEEESIDWGGSSQ